MTEPIIRRIAIAAFAAAAAVTPAAGDSVAEFYRGRTIAMVIGTGPGGSYDLYARTIAPHLARHIPGHPAIVMEYMPGAGGVAAANHVYGQAPQDGTKILLSPAITLAEKLTPNGVRFESARMQWLGAFDAITQMMTIWHTVPVRTIAELATADITIGTFSKSSLDYQLAALLKGAIGAKYQLITGLRSGNEHNLAMERGEIHGWPASWEILNGTRPHWLTERKVRFLAQFTIEREPQLSDVPTLLELSPPAMRDVAEFVVAGTPVARAMAFGPRVPSDRVAALRKAFADTLQDSALLNDAKDRKLGIAPRTHEQVLALVLKTVTASPELVARVKQTTGQAE